MKTYMQSIGTDFVVEEGHNSGDKDFTGGILACKDAGCDVVIGWTHAAEAAVIARQYVEMGMQNVPFLGCPTWGNGSFYDLVEEQYVDGTYIAGDFALTNASPVASAYYEAYKTKFGKDADAMSTYWYDGTMMALDAMDRAKELTREGVLEAIKTIGVERELELTCGKVVMNGIDSVHQMLIGKNKGKVFEVIDVVTEEVK
ncbi:hypothetical protein SDC9_151602 [bioreactor metagenome]|uniref:Leucine-binding protein domain-containing protein n=1 Tax=bioreactor metagenome TaxID=1076179 RepID=A0A645EQR2_9ZZZZ